MPGWSLVDPSDLLSVSPPVGRVRVRRYRLLLQRMFRLDFLHEMQNVSEIMHNILIIGGILEDNLKVYSVSCGHVASYRTDYCPVSCGRRTVLERVFFVFFCWEGGGTAASSSIPRSASVTSASKDSMYPP